MNRESATLAFLEDMNRRGVELRVEGGNIFFRPMSSLSDRDRETMRTLKARILQLLETDRADMGLLFLCSALSPGDAQVLREERAAILEFEAGFTAFEAERRAGIS